MSNERQTISVCLCVVDICVWEKREKQIGGLDHVMVRAQDGGRDHVLSKTCVS